MRTQTKSRNPHGGHTVSRRWFLQTVEMVLGEDILKVFIRRDEGETENF